MVITEIIVVKNNNINRKNYNEAIISEDEDCLILDFYKMPKNSNKKIDVKCDYCGEIRNIKICDYNRIMNRNTNEKYACKKCKKYKIKEKMLNSYGVENCSQLSYVKDKKKRTTRNNYGCDYPMQSDIVKEKSRKSMLEKYGVEHNIYRKEVKDKILISNSHQKFFKCNAPCSKAQRHISELCNGILNFPFDRYNLDILLDDKIYIEYNGSGHKMNVKMGNISEEEFIRKETIRYNMIKKEGYKEIIIENFSDKLPQDDIILDIISGLCVFLKQSEANWVKIDFDSMKITTKNCQIFYMIN